MYCDCSDCVARGNCQYCNDACSFGCDYSGGAFNYTNFISR